MEQLGQGQLDAAADGVVEGDSNGVGTREVKVAMCVYERETPAVLQQRRRVPAVRGRAFGEEDEESERPHGHASHDPGKWAWAAVSRQGAACE